MAEKRKTAAALCIVIVIAIAIISVVWILLSHRSIDSPVPQPPPIRIIYMTPTPNASRIPSQPIFEESSDSGELKTSQQ